ncbi:LysM peptidoglycan-binding domain-containing M23 family metallopeptidase [Truepera radiovictrix]|uniref:LysM peptidoglycan-binding domain-containing M23 family metallopeptidase n=1 Tax=Truepera radiovictrix TaxID=332249 RepID=UPI00161D30FC|nr:M23 family metallopeptidase [Truepera radiovictrix]WMT56025.1 LysM peptidoglycan-binding domain-containing M23 family metallopeptidase [Truepera radiovictrix]
MSAPPSFRSHVVASGETLAALAARYGLSEALLRAANPHLWGPATAPLPAGAHLNVPPQEGELVVLAAGEDALSVALRYGHAPAAVARANGLRSLVGLPAGTLLLLPAEAAAHARDDGRYLWPLEHAGRVTSAFGPRTLEVAGNTFHRGLDIAAPEGTPVRAARAGTVSFSGWGGAYGYVVYLEHEGGAQTRYAHLRAPGAPVGRTLAPGEPLGAVGSTGASTGPHLHFELRLGGEPVDPAPYLQAYDQAAYATR